MRILVVKRGIAVIAAGAAIFFAATHAASQASKADADYLRSGYDTYRAMASSSPYSSIPWQYLGPTNISGRATDIAVADTRSGRRIYAGYATGGVWESDDEASHGSRSSTTLRPPASAISPWRHPIRTFSGSAPASPTSSARRCPGSASTSPPTAAGRSPTWGLPDTQTIGRIVVHPANPDTVYVAASGHEWTDNQNRGVFKTTDGGRTWKKVFYEPAAPAPSIW